jgi:putative salt-induced outer membrane protein YdiY
MNFRTVIFICLLMVAPLLARDSTDVIVMKNGDRLTGEIKGLDGGVLYISMQYILGTSQVQWSKVDHIDSKQLFLVKTEDGSVYTGALSTAEVDGGRPASIEVVESPDKQVALEQRRVVQMDTTSEKFLQRFNGEINTGIIYSKGNQSTQFNLSSDVSYPRERWVASASYNSTLSTSTGVSPSARNQFSLGAQRLLRWNNWFYGGVGDFLQSSVQGIELQSSLGGGVGRFLANTNHATISVLGGFAWQRTRYAQSIVPAGTQNVAAGVVAGNVKLFRFNKTTLNITASVFPAISDPGRLYANVNVAYYVKITGNLSWNVSFYGNWDNQPPPTFSGSDYGTSSGLSWTFGNK